MGRYDPCALLVRRLHLSLTRRANNGLKAFDMTASQLMVLEELARVDGELTLKELEHRLPTSQPDMVGIVARLEKKRLVRGWIDPDDRRVKRVRLTDEGERCRAEAAGEMDRAEEQLLSGMTEAERSELRRLLLKATAGG